VRVAREEKITLSIKLRLALACVALISIAMLFMFLDVLYQETIAKQKVQFEFQGIQFGVAFTDKGTFDFHDIVRSRRNYRNSNWRYWNDVRAVSLQKLRWGCRYDVIISESILSGQHLGAYQMPPTLKIMKVLRRVEATESECDISALSGKPVCREDQVMKDKKGIRPIGKSCDFQTYLMLKPR
jgi:hypothetical protein